MGTRPDGRSEGGGLQLGLLFVCLIVCLFICLLLRSESPLPSTQTKPDLQHLDTCLLFSQHSLGIEVCDGRCGSYARRIAAVRTTIPFPPCAIVGCFPPSPESQCEPSDEALQHTPTLYERESQKGFGGGYPRRLCTGTYGRMRHCPAGNRPAGRSAYVPYLLRGLPIVFLLPFPFCRLAETRTRAQQTHGDTPSR